MKESNINERLFTDALKRLAGVFAQRLCTMVRAVRRYRIRHNINIYLDGY